MAHSTVSATCGACERQFSAQLSAKPARSFLGFPRVTCPKCDKYILFPLTPGYRILYWVILVSMVISSIGYLKRGEIPIPGLLGIAAIVGIVKDIKLRRRVSGLGTH